MQTFLRINVSDIKYAAYGPFNIAELKAQGNEPPNAMKCINLIKRIFKMNHTVHYSREQILYVF